MLNRVPSAEPRPRRDRITGAAWAAAAVSTCAVVCVLLFVTDSTQFYRNDAQAEYMPIMRELGLRLRSGEWQFINDRSWIGGMIGGNVQYAIFNPVSLLSYVGISLSGDLALASACLAGGYLALSALGGFLLARSHGVRPSLSFAVGVSVGSLPYLFAVNAAAWIPGLVSYCWAIWAAVAVRRGIDSRMWRIGGAFAVYLLFTSGWVHSIVAGCLFVAAAVLCVAPGTDRRGQVAAGVAAVGGALAGLVPFAVARGYVGWSNRQSDWYTDGFLSTHLESWVQSFSPAVEPYFEFFPNNPMGTPLGFAALWLPLGVMLATRPAWRRSAGWVVAAVSLAVLAVGPSHAGPVRWSFRFMPFVAVSLVMASVVLIEHGRPRRLDRRTCVVAVAGSAFFAFAVDPGPTAPLTTGAIVSALLLTAGLATPIHRRAVVDWVVVAGAVVGVGLLGVAGHLRPIFGDWRADRHVDQAQAAASVFRGRTLFLHDTSGATSTHGALPLLIDGTESVNGYSSVAPGPLADQLCFNAASRTTCDESLDRLAAVDPGVGVPVIDMFGLDAVVTNPRFATEVRSRLSSDWRESATFEQLTRFEPAHTTRRFVTVAPAHGFSAGTTVLARPWYPGAVVIADGNTWPTEPYRGIFVAVRADLSGARVVDVHYELIGDRTALALAVAGLAMVAASVHGSTTGRITKLSGGRILGRLWSARSGSNTPASSATSAPSWCTTSTPGRTGR
jgi:hypothetical protein